MNKILVVDDMATDRAAVVKFLESNGYACATADSGSAALEHVKQETPSLVLLDVVMPQVDGFATCRRLKKDPQTAGVPVVILTGKDQPSDEFWARRQGADGFMNKPFDGEALLSTIHQHLGAN